MGFADRVRDRARQAAETASSGLGDALPGGTQPESSTAEAPSQVSSPLPVGAVAPASANLRPRWEYQTEVLTSVMGRDKLRTGDLDTALKRRGDQGWELVSCNLDADLKGSRDGHLLIFKREI